MSLQDIVNVSVQLSAPGLTAPGFGTPLVLATASDVPGSFTNRVRAYANAAGAAADYALTSGTYLQLAKLFSQNPTVPQAKVGRCASDWTQVFTITVLNATTTAGTVYAITIDGVTTTFTDSSGSQTAAQIATSIDGALDTAAPVGITVANPSGGVITLTANTAGAFHTCSVSDITLLQLAQTQGAEATLAADLAAIQLEDPAWYALLCPFPSKATGTAMDTFVEANGKLALIASGDSATAQVALGSDTGGGETLAATLFGSGALRSAVFYHGLNGEFADAALAGHCLPLNPGSETWALKTLNGVTTDKLTETQRNNLLAKCCNFYEAVSAPNSTSSVNVTNPGKVAGNEYIDVIRFRDWVQVNIQVEVFNVLIQGNKLPYTDPGIGAVKAAVLTVLDRGVLAGGIVPGSTTCSAPLAASVSGSDRTGRVLNNVTFTAQLAGAIQAANIQGTLNH